MKLEYTDNLTIEQKAFVNTAKEFAKEYISKNSLKWDKEEFFPREVLKKAAGLGFGGIYVSENDGGTGLKRIDASLIFEELAFACPSTSAFLSIHNMAAWMLSEFGSKEIKEKYIKELVSMEKIASYCLTEPGAGSDAASLLTSATANKKNSSLKMNGSKAFISGAGESELYFVMARTENKNKINSSDISCLIVEKDYKGLSFGKNESKMGWKNQPTRAVIFDDCEIPSTNIVGRTGEGFKIAMQGLDGGRINIASCSLGAAKYCIERSLEYVKERKQFGKFLKEYQSIQFKIADMITEYNAARLIVHQAAEALDNKLNNSTYLSAMAKRYATDACFNICNEALQIHGGYGYLSDFGIEKMVRDCRVHQILEGTNEIMRIIIARNILG